MASRRLQGDWPDRHGMGAIGPRDNRAPGPMLGRLARTSREAQAQCRGGDGPSVDYKAPGPIDLATRLQRGCTAGRGDWPHASGRAPGPPTQHGAIGPQRKKHARPESEAPTQSAPRRRPTGSRAPSPSGTARERGAPAEPGARPEPHGDPTGSGGGTRQQAQQEAQTRKPHTASTARPAQPEAHTAPQAATRTTSSTQRTARSTAGRAHTGHTPQETPHTPASKASTTRKQARQARPGPTNGATHRRHTRGHTERRTPQTPASTTHARKADTRGHTHTQRHTAGKQHPATTAPAAHQHTQRQRRRRDTTTTDRPRPRGENNPPQRFTPHRIVLLQRAEAHWTNKSQRAEQRGHPAREREAPRPREPCRGAGAAPWPKARRPTSQRRPSTGWRRAARRRRRPPPARGRRAKFVTAHNAERMRLRTSLRNVSPPQICGRRANLATLAGTPHPRRWVAALRRRLPRAARPRRHDAPGRARSPAAARSAWVQATHRRRSPGSPRGARTPPDDPPPHDGEVGESRAISTPRHQKTRQHGPTRPHLSPESEHRGTPETQAIWRARRRGVPAD